MALGVAVVGQRFENPREILGDRLREGSIYRLLADHGENLAWHQIEVGVVERDDAAVALDEAASLQDRD